MKQTLTRFNKISLVIGFAFLYPYFDSYCL